jgi:hypothetical protein
LLAAEVEKEFCEAGVSVIDPFRKGAGGLMRSSADREASPAVCGSAGLPRR